MTVSLNPGQLRPIEQLRAHLTSGALPQRLASHGWTVLDRLERPVRLAIVGRDTAPCLPLLNGLLGRLVLSPGKDVPPVVVRFGDQASARVTEDTGAVLSLSLADLEHCAYDRMALLELSLPLPVLERLQMLYVPLEGDASDAAAALAWATARSDMLVWCLGMPAGSATNDLELMERLPAHLRDHASLVAPAGGHRAARTLFPRIYDLPSAGPVTVQAVEPLRTALLDHVGRARQEDMDGALALIRKHLVHNPNAQASLEPPISAKERPSSVPTTLGRTPTRRQISHTTLLSNADRVLADCGRSLRDTLAGSDGNVPVAQITDTCLQALEALDAMDMPHKTASLVAQAQDMGLLMSVEQTSSAAEDTAALMVQVRRLLLCDAAA